MTARDVRASRSKTERNRDKAALRGGFARYRQYADKQMDMFPNKKQDRGIFEESVRRFGKLDGMGMLLTTFCREHGVLHSASFIPEQVDAIRRMQNFEFP